MATSQRSQLISLYEALIKCWNNRDAKGMAGLYATGGAQIGFDGSSISGPNLTSGHWQCNGDTLISTPDPIFPSKGTWTLNRTGNG